MRVKLQPDQRVRVIVTAALRIGQSEGIAAVNHSAVAKRCAVETSRETVKHYFPLKSDLWDAVVKADETGEMAKQRLVIDG